jgi:hypothetical protein
VLWCRRATGGVAHGEMFEICREMLKAVGENVTWAHHVSYSNDVLLVDEKV